MNKLKMNNLLRYAVFMFIALFGFAGTAFYVFAQEPETSESEEIDLDDYDIIMEDKRGLTFTAESDTPNIVTREEMEREGAKDLWEALRNVPGIIQSGGGTRNDSSFTVRGFDSASMPIYVDGVTQANP